MNQWEPVFLLIPRKTINGTWTWGHAERRWTQAFDMGAWDYRIQGTNVLSTEERLHNAILKPEVRC